MKKMILLLVFFACNNAPKEQAVTSTKQEEPKKDILALKPEVVVDWSGYSSNNIIRLINADSSLSQNEILKYAKILHYQTKTDQNIYLFYYHGNAPKSIPIPQFEQTNPKMPEKTGLNGAMEFVKKSNPFLTIQILGEREFSVSPGFAG